MSKVHRRPVHDRPAWRGAAAAVAVATAALFAGSTADQVADTFDAAALQLVLTDVAVAVAAAGVVAGLAALTLGRFVALSWAYLWVTLSSTKTTTTPVAPTRPHHSMTVAIAPDSMSHPSRRRRR